MKLNSKELATVLHGLRLIQCEGRIEGCNAGMCPHFEDSTQLTNEEIDELCERINVVEGEPLVIVEIYEGTGSVYKKPEDVGVRIVDMDMFRSGDHTLTGENAVTEEYRAFLEKHFPGWYADQLESEEKYDADSN